MIIFKKTEKTITISEIEEIERYVNLKFPNEYKEHLLKYNGGKCEPNIFSFNENGKITSSCINWFLSISKNENYSIKDDIDTYKIDEKRMPNHILPIADDPGGNAICISCGENDYGYIYFWDHEMEVDYTISDDNDYSNMYLIAKSFNEFLNGLISQEDYLKNENLDL